MAFSCSTFQFLCMMCCIIAVTSYRINHRPSIDDRNERAVTEWRFRRNYLLNFPHLFQNYGRNNHLETEESDDYNQGDVIKLNEKINNIPELIHRRHE